MVEKGVNLVHRKNNVTGNKGSKIGRQYKIGMHKTKKFITKTKIKHGASFAKTMKWFKG